MEEKFNYQKWIDSVSYNYSEAIGLWADRVIKKECNPILHWLLIHTKNKYIVKLAGFEIRQETPCLDNNYFHHTEMWRRGKFVAEFNYQLNIKK